MARTHTSFSAGRRWGIFFSVMISIAAMASLVVMLNYLGARHSLRFNWSTKTSQPLSLPTINLINSITNDVKVTIYYDKSDSLYNDIADLLNQYHLANPKISVQTVDYYVDTAAAILVKNRCHLDSSEEKNLIIYEYSNQVPLITSGDNLANYSVDAAQDDSQPDGSGQSKIGFNRHVAQFNGEAMVDADLIRVTGPALKACYLTGNGEIPLEHQGQAPYDYANFARTLADNHIALSTLSLTGTNTIPADCNLLIIASPQYALAQEEQDKIRQYLANGRRLFVLFNNYRVEHVVTGLEPILAEWGVQVGMDMVVDSDNMTAGGGLAILNFNPNHPCVSRLAGGSRLLLYPPRSLIPVRVVTPTGQDAPTVAILATAGPRAFVSRGGSQYAVSNVPVILAVEKKNVTGVRQLGTTRIVVAGDSLFLTSAFIGQDANQDFAELAVRWLLDQAQSMGGVAPRGVTEYKVNLTRAEMRNIRWIFLGAMPGGILLLGGLVWLRRRH